MSNDKTCGALACFRYTWPGRDEAFVCLEHAVGLANVARAIGLHLQLIPINPMDYDPPATCNQKRSEGHGEAQKEAA